jgi:soluble lytic murein transglycosylase-like protein
VSLKTKLAAASCAVAAGVVSITAGLTSAAAAEPGELEFMQLPAERLERSIDVHRETVEYRTVLAQARKLEVAPQQNLLEARRVEPRELDRASGVLRDRIKKAQREPEYGLAPGVSMATLEAIAACESGGDPTAVNAAGYYGKYQFDMSTWASVGGSGNPAEAPEAEQDYRASVLYSRAGSSPWPVCG